MKKLIALTLISTAALFAQEARSTGQKAAPGKATKLSRVEVDKLLANPTTLFIDVRRPDEISTIGGFPVYLSIQAKDLEQHLAEIPRDRTVVTVSNHANRAVRAADLLDSKGFKVAGAAGIEDYESEGGAITKIPVPPPAPAKK